MKPVVLTVTAAALASALSKRSTDASPPQTLDRVWSGVKQSGSGFTSVTGTFTVPKGGKSFGPSIWVGIDGSTECPGGGLLQTGVRLTGNGTAFGWFEWVPLSAPVFEDFQVSEGDDIRMTVHAYGPSNGSAILDNLSTGQTWIVEDYNNSGGNDTGIVASPDYGTIVIRNASAQGSAGTVTPEGGELIELFDTRTGTVLSQCSAGEEEVTCKYVGPPTQG
ncbi:concanavalin A-like lectin/glucanase [Trichoderma citrinoviride]|uniref:Concanavalin A-like lectin/glucanase n=1 Tax=Trichoderma citrinoviride TaxID=58853 RepID=A0A2T4B5E9_9HYPO|nr:concanavalin A-like lectin/glucanase [Trichoderma citrinoviride]PTB64498.1 concanavalin A-like lectin/glucanase [Trichoderma citrinoviride]